VKTQELPAQHFPSSIYHQINGYVAYITAQKSSKEITRRLLSSNMKQMFLTLCCKYHQVQNRKKSDWAEIIESLRKEIEVNERQNSHKWK
jgi:hypothetical protein